MEKPSAAVTMSLGTLLQKNVPFSPRNASANRDVELSHLSVFRLHVFLVLSCTQLKPSRCIALTAYCQSRPESYAH